MARVARAVLRSTLVPAPGGACKAPRAAPGPRRGGWVPAFPARRRLAAWFVGPSARATGRAGARRHFPGSAGFPGAVLAGAEPMHDEHDHDHGTHLTDVELRVRALESVLVAKGYVDPKALDLLIET